MTYQTCERLAANCRKHGDEAGALIYDERAARKKKKLGIVDSKEK